MQDSRKYRRCISLFCGLILLLAGQAGAVVQDTLRPEADIYSEAGEWDVHGDSPRHECVDDVVSDDDDTYLDEDDDNKGYIYRTGDWSGDGDPDSAEACFLIRKAEAFNNFTVAIGRAAAPEGIFTWCGEPDTVTEGTQSYVLFKYMMLTDPCTDAAWTTASINHNSYGFGIRFARGAPAAIGRYTQGYVVVYSTAAAEGGQVIIIGALDEENYHNPRRGIPPAAWE